VFINFLVWPFNTCVSSNNSLIEAPLYYQITTSLQHTQIQNESTFKGSFSGITIDIFGQHESTKWVGSTLGVRPTMLQAAECSATSLPPLAPPNITSNQLFTFCYDPISLKHALPTAGRHHGLLPTADRPHTPRHLTPWPCDFSSAIYVLFTFPCIIHIFFGTISVFNL
jgi:hypothetical protein